MYRLSQRMNKWHQIVAHMGEGGYSASVRHPHAFVCIKARQQIAIPKQPVRVFNLDTWDTRNFPRLFVL